MKAREASRRSLGVQLTKKEKKEFMKGAPVKLNTRTPAEIDKETETLLSPKGSLAPNRIVLRRKKHMENLETFVIPMKTPPKERKQLLDDLIKSMIISRNGWDARHEFGIFDEVFAGTMADKNLHYGDIDGPAYQKAKEAYRSHALRHARSGHSGLPSTFGLDALETTMRGLTTSDLITLTRNGGKLGDWFLARLITDDKTFGYWKSILPTCQQSFHESEFCSCFSVSRRVVFCRLQMCGPSPFLCFT